MRRTFYVENHLSGLAIHRNAVPRRTGIYNAFDPGDGGYSQPTAQDRGVRVFIAGGGDDAAYATPLEADGVGRQQLIRHDHGAAGQSCEGVAASVN